MVVEINRTRGIYLEPCYTFLLYHAGLCEENTFSVDGVPPCTDCPEGETSGPGATSCAPSDGMCVPGLSSPKLNLLYDTAHPRENIDVPPPSRSALLECDFDER